MKDTSDANENEYDLMKDTSDAILSDKESGVDSESDEKDPFAESSSGSDDGKIARDRKQFSVERDVVTCFSFSSLISAIKLEKL